MAALATTTAGELHTPENLKSKVWRYFGFESVDGELVKKSTVCKICRSKLTYLSTTTNLRAHLTTTHPGILEEEGEQEWEGSGSASSHQQVKIDSMFTPARGLPYARQSKATDMLARFICEDMRPVNLLYGSGFQAFIRELEPRFQIPCPRTMNGKIAKLYESTKCELRDMLRGEKLALTTDGWSSLATESYVTVTAHFINADWELRNFVLDTVELHAAHTAANVSTCIAGILHEYGIEKESALAITTDNASNYVNAVERHLGIPDIPCMAHTLNLAARRGLGQRSDATAVSRLKAAAQHFKTSTSDSYLLEAKQKLLGVQPLQLINDCPTRWNSTYDMISQAADQQAPVAAVIMEKKLSKLELSSAEWTLMEKVKDVLKPFKVATEALSTEHYPTASAVLPLQYVLLTQLQPSAQDQAAVKEMKTCMSADLKSRYDPDKDAFLILNTASFLDPRFHRLVHLKAESREAVRAKVQRELGKLVEGEGREDGDAMAEPHQLKGKALSTMGNLFGDMFCQQLAGVRRNENVIEVEIMAYESEPPPPSDSNPLSWWKERNHRYPNLAKLARGYLAICGTSVRAERVFSTAGNIVTKKRSSLEPEHVSQLVFLANNLKYK